MIQKSPKEIANSPYSYLLVNKSLRHSLALVVIISSVILSAFIFLELRRNGHVGLMALYTAAICSVVTFFPQTEKWIYKPWQKAPQKLESHEGR